MLCPNVIEEPQTRTQYGGRGRKLIVAVICDHLSKVKEALLSQCNMDRMLKEEAIHAVSEMDGRLNRLNDIFLGSESTLKHAVLAIEKGKERSFSEEIAASTGTKVNQPKGYHTVAHPSDDPPSTFGLIVKAADSKLHLTRQKD